MWSPRKSISSNETTCICTAPLQVGLAILWFGALLALFQELARKLYALGFNPWLSLSRLILHQVFSTCGAVQGYGNGLVKRYHMRQNERRSPRKKFADWRINIKRDAVCDIKPTLVPRFSLSIFFHSARNGFTPVPTSSHLPISRHIITLKSGI